MKTLDIETFPLHGIRLIEASAGTGKTFTIAGLYLRLLLEQNLQVTQILVVTFTEAATQELRGRIRQRIHNALRWLEDDSRLQKTDDATLLEKYRCQSDIIQRLRDAVTCMDEACIFTIHGFCQRSLGDSAFESGVLFDSEFTTDLSHLQQQVIRDFWRRTVTDPGVENAAWILERWGTPDELAAEIRPLVEKDNIQVLPDPETLSLEILEDKQQQAYFEFCEEWRQSKEDAYALLAQSPLLGRAATTFKIEVLDHLFHAVDEFVGHDKMPVTLPPSFELITTTKIADPGSHLQREIKKGTLPPAHPMFDLAQSVSEMNLVADVTREVLFLTRAAAYMREETDRRKQNSRMMSFDDLLTKLDSALSSGFGEGLAAHIRNNYPVAMIDEFQDTDPKQYRIFSRIYQRSENASLFMIGDPKQAIYSFRGADIFTYMKARSDTDVDSHFTLGINYRSHAMLIEGVNTIFKKATAPFIFHEEIVFEPVGSAPVQAKPESQPLMIDGELPSPLVCWHVPKTTDNENRGVITKKWAGLHVARGTAAEISQLLTLGQEGKACLEARHLAASDIAVLVRDRYEAADIRSALAELGIASVYISRDSVFSTDEAVELSHVLRTMTDPSNGTLLRTAFATRMIGMTAYQIHELHHDEQAWEIRVQSFIEYQRIWNQKGFMPMFHQLMREQGVIANLLSSADGERRMTNLLQLAELIQAASVNHIGIENLLRWIEVQRNQPDGDSDEQQLRVESDDNLVRIVTIHKSKGLEFPIVFLPYIWSSKPVKDTRIIQYHDKKRKLIADLGSEQKAQGLLLARKESLAEDVRLLYVAITRAKYRCYFSWGKFTGASDSAMGYLLHQEKNSETGEISCNMSGLDDEAIRQALLSLNPPEAAFLSIEPLPEKGNEFRPDEDAEEQVQALTFEGQITQQWRLTSFSALTRNSGYHAAAHIELPDHDQVDLGQRENQSIELLTPFTFHRGQKAGNFLHHLFEHTEFTLASADGITPLVSQSLDQYGFDQKWAPVITEWVLSVLNTPLDPDGELKLRQVTDKKKLVEMEFHFPLDALDADDLNSVLASSRGSLTGSESLDFPVMSGLMKGFIDLVFEHDGRFYVLDYKSNYLGYDYGDYRVQDMKQAMYEHYYDLQYLVYTLALHRYLRSRIPDYDYAAHFGGVYYLFLRGMTPANGHETGVYYDRPEQTLIERLDRACSTSEDALHA